MKQYVLAAIVCCTSLCISAQTRRIAYRSHSGGNAGMMATTMGDYFGVVPEDWLYRDRKPEKLRLADTVKVIKVKPWKPVTDSLPPKVNPVYTRRGVKHEAVKGKR